MSGICAFKGGGSVVESIQEVILNIGAGNSTLDVSVSAMDPDFTEILIQGQDRIASLPESSALAVSITSSTNVRLSRDDTTAGNMLMQVVIKEYKSTALNQAIQRGTILTSSGQVSNTDTITAVGSLAYATNLGTVAASSSTTPTHLSTVITLPNSTTVDCTRAGSGVNATTNYQVVDPV